MFSLFKKEYILSDWYDIAKGEDDESLDKEAMLKMYTQRDNIEPDVHGDDLQTIIDKDILNHITGSSDNYEYVEFAFKYLNANPSKRTNVGEVSFLSYAISVIHHDGIERYFELMKPWLINHTDEMLDSLAITTKKYNIASNIFSDIFVDWVYENNLNELSKKIFSQYEDSRFVPQEVRDMFIF